MSGPPRETPGEAATLAFASYYDSTIARAYGLALRITGSEELAVEACDAAYPGAWNGPPPPAETALLARVRAEALARRPAGRSDRAAAAYSVRGELERGLAELDILARRSVELAYFGGMDVASMGELLGVDRSEVRAALRRGLLQLGNALRATAERRP